MKKFTINQNEFLNLNIQGFYHTDYVAYENRNKIDNYPMYILTLKNDLNRNWWSSKLQDAQQELLKVLLTDLSEIFKQIALNNVTVCVVPRAKAENTYRKDQLLFKETVKNAVNQLGKNFIDGTNFIERHTNTKTTHLRRAVVGFTNDGSKPYSGISQDTCNFLEKIKGCDILLIDDIYTGDVNIDEDMIKALLDNGAKSVIFYAVGKTTHIF
jgi:chromosomal replication initiation ATPase DnaA